MTKNKSLTTELTPKILKKLQQIKTKYGFRDDIDLVEHLVSMKNWLDGISDHESNKDISDRKKVIKKRRQLIIKLIETFNFNFDYVENDNFIVNLEIQKENLEKEIQSLPTKRGSPIQSTSRRCAAFLINIYANGTIDEGQQPRPIKCWNPTQKIHTNNFYSFVEDIYPLMLKIGIKIKAKSQTQLENASEFDSPK